MKRVFHILKITSICLVSLLILLLITGFIIVRYFEDDVVAYALKRIESQLDTKMNIGNADLSLWHSFPMASIKLEEVYIEETFAEKDTLIFAKSVLFKFSLSDLFEGEYRVREIQASNATGYFKINEKGEDNWHFWKDQPADTGKFTLTLESVLIESTNIVFENRKNKIFLDFHNNEAFAEGNFSGEEFDMELDLNGKLNSLISDETEYGSGRTLEIQSLLEINSTNNHLALGESEIVVDDIPLTVEGKVDYGDKAVLDLRIRTKNLKLAELINQLPPGIRKVAESYDLSGNVSLDSKFKGDYGSNKMPAIDSEITISNGSMVHHESGVAMSNISGQGKYQKKPGKKDVLTIEGMKADLASGSMTLNGRMEQLSSPLINLNVEAELELQKLQQFFSWDTLEVCNGQILANGNISGRISRSEADSSFDWRSIIANGKTVLTNAAFKVKGSHLQYNEMNGTILLDKDRAMVENLTSNINGNVVSMSGSLDNLLGYLLTDDERLQIDAQAQCATLDFGNWIETEDHTSRNDDYHFSLPERIDFNLNTSIDNFVFRKFEATTIRGIVKLDHRFLSIDPVSFVTAGGDFLSQLTFEQTSSDLFMMKCIADIRKLDISKFFAEFGNFGQEFITNQHLQGLTNATISFSAPLSTSLEIQQKGIVSLIDISIENGRLIGLESLQQIATYIKKNKLVAPFVNEDLFAEKMKDIRFSKLENTIEIRNRIITIPAMDIRTTAMDITAQGTHTFDNKIDYSFSFYLRDLLIRKEKDLEEVDDKLGKQMFIYMRGDVDDPEFGIDKEMSKEHRKEKMLAEKQNVKALLKEELGIFRNDMNVGTYKEEKQETGTTTSIEWSELDVKEEEKPVTTPVKKDKKKVVEEPAKPKKKIPKWLQEKEEKDEEPE